MKIYEILPNLYLGAVLEVDDSTEGIPLGWTRTGVDLEPGQWAVWQGTAWLKTQEPPPEPEAANSAPRTKITADAFFDRLGAEKFKIYTETREPIQTIVSEIKLQAWVDLADAVVRDRLNAINTLGYSLLVDQILLAEVQDHELWIQES